MAISKDTLAKCSEHLSAYKAACEEHPDLKSFDSTLQQRTSKVIDSLTAEDETGLLSQHALHNEVSNHLHEVHQAVADFILQSENHVLENEKLKSLVLAYFDNTIKTLEIFDKVMGCVDEAEMGELLIKQAVNAFDKEVAEDDVVGKKNKYEKTLKKLKEFKEKGNPFDGQVFTTQFELVKKQQESLLEEVCKLKKKLHDESESLKRESLISNVVFGAAFALVAVASIALMATGVGAPAGAGIAALAEPLLVTGWAGVYTILERKKKDLKKQEAALKKLEDKTSEIEKGMVTNEQALKIVIQLVGQLGRKISLVLEVVVNAIESEEENDEEDTRLAMKLVRERVITLTEKLKEVGENVAKQSKLVRDACFLVQKKIVS